MGYIHFAKSSLGIYTFRKKLPWDLNIWGKVPFGNINFGKSYIFWEKCKKWFTFRKKIPWGTYIFGKLSLGYVNFGKVSLWYIYIWEKVPFGYIHLGKVLFGYIHFGKVPTGNINLGKSSLGIYQFWNKLLPWEIFI